MKKLFFVALLVGVATYCGDTGKPFKDLTGFEDGQTSHWKSSDFVVGSDTCNFFDSEITPASMFSNKDFTISINGSSLILDTDIALPLLEDAILVATSDIFSEDEAQVDPFFSYEKTYVDCTGTIDEDFSIQTAANQSDTGGTTLDVIWTHTETDSSSVSGACSDKWEGPLPCTTVLTFTLTEVTD